MWPSKVLEILSGCQVLEASLVKHLLGLLILLCYCVSLSSGTVCYPQLSSQAIPGGTDLCCRDAPEGTTEPVGHGWWETNQHAVRQVCWLELKPLQCMLRGFGYSKVGKVSGILALLWFVCLAVLRAQILLGWVCCGIVG